MDVTPRGRFRPFFVFPLISALILGLTLQVQSQESPRFRRYTIEDGLSQSSVYSILQDRRGFMWFATQDGLNRFDGHVFKIFRSTPAEAASLSTSFATSLAEDSRGFLWVGTEGGGLNRYDASKETFQQFKHNPADPRTLASDIISSVLADESGRVWVGTSRGLDCYDPASQSFRHFRNSPRDETSLSHDWVTVLYADSQRRLWVGTAGGGLNSLDSATGRFTRFLGDATVRAILDDDGIIWAGLDDGLARLDPKSGRATTFRNDPGRNSSLGFNRVTCLLKDQNQVLWVGTGNGLDQFDRKTGGFVHFRNEAADINSLSDDNLLCLYSDRSGGFWVGTEGGGLSRLDRVSIPFNIMRDKSNTPSRKRRNNIWSIVEDEGGTLWVGTDAGLHSVNRRTGDRAGFENNARDPGSISENVVRAVALDGRGALWAGTASAGLNRLDPTGKSFTHFRHDPKNPDSLGSDSIRFLLRHTDGSMWVATMGGGLEHLDPAARRFRHFRHDPADPLSLAEDRVYTLCLDRSGFLWVGTWGAGLDRLDPRTGRFEHFRPDPLDKFSLSDNNILSILEGRGGVIWVGTRGGGLCRLDPQNWARKRFTIYGENEGLPNSNIYAILEDDAGFLWLSHNRGLSRFDPRTAKVKTFGLGHGLQSLEFNGNSRFKSPSGEMFFGGINGLNVFFPGRIKDNPYPPQAAITKLQVYNKAVSLAEGDSGASLNRTPGSAPAVRLSHTDNMITLEFAALHYAAPEDNQYAYRLSGIDKKWNWVGNRRLATYTNLPPGQYVFQVRASNNDGLWNEAGASLSIIITPPFWETLWFRLLAGFLVLGTLAAAVVGRTRSLNEQKKRLEIKVEERTNELMTINRKLEEEAASRLWAQDALRQEKLNLDLLIDNAPEAIVVVDREHRITRVNSEFTKLFGWASDEVLHKDIDDVVAPPDLRDEARTITQQLDGGRNISFESRRRRKDGRLIDIAGIGAPVHGQGRTLGYFAIYRDIADRKKAEAAIRKRATQAAFINRVGQRVSTKLEIGPLLQEIVDAVHETFSYYGVHLFLLDESRRRLKLQAMAGGYKDIFPQGVDLELGTGMIGNAALLGRSLVSADVSRDPYFIHFADEVTKSELAVPIRRGPETIGVLDLQSDELAAFDETDVAAMETLSSQVASAMDNARLYEGMEQELFQRRRAETMLKSLTDDLARSNKELEQFAYMASHDLQEPMRMVASYVQLLAKRYAGKLDSDADDFIHFAVDGAFRMQNMINDLLAYSRVGMRGKPFAPTESEAALEQALANLRLGIAEKKAVITHGPLPTVKADDTQLGQVFQNLVGNAIKFQGSNTPRVHVSAQRREGFWEFSVQDNGIGIDPRYQDRIFKIFERLHRANEYSGTGIGLAICKKIVERHGGRIWVESQPGRGSKFFFTIPASPA